MDVHVRSEEELMEFAQYLFNLAEAMVEHFSEANNKMNSINEGWNDDQNLRFMEQFREATEAIHNISEMMNEYSGFIRRYAGHIAAIKNVR